MVVTALFLFLFSYWSYASHQLLLTHYGYVTDGASETERYGNVAPENLEQVKRLQLSVTGIGWPLKALMMFELYWPYLLVVYLGSYFLPKIRQSFSGNV